jgi:hypothetical protein
MMMNTPNQSSSKAKAEKLGSKGDQSQQSGQNLSSGQKTGGTKDSSSASKDGQQVTLASQQTLQQKKKNKQKNVALLHSMPKNLEEE